MGGLGIQNPVLTADVEFHDSVVVTRNLTDLIERQEQDLSNYNQYQIKLDIQRIKSGKEEMLLGQLEEVKEIVDFKL